MSDGRFPAARGRRFTAQDEAFLRGLATIPWPADPDEDPDAVSAGRTQRSYTNLGHEGKRRADRLVALRLLVIEDDMLVLIQPAPPRGHGLRVVR